MRCEYRPNDPKYFATNLQKNALTNTLKWDSTPGQSVLIVQTKYKEPANKSIAAICQHIEQNGLSDMQIGFEEISPDVKVRFISALDSVKLNGCPLNGEASTYTVFACEIDDEVCIIFEPTKGAMITPQCDIPLKVHLDITRLVYDEGALFWKKEVESDFWEIRFPKNLEGAYNDGDLQYQIGTIKIPVTKKMVKEGFYIKSSNKPVFLSVNKGLSLV